MAAAHFHRPTSESGGRCMGRSRAWHARWRNEPHEAYQPHPPCRRCGADMGCRRCSGPSYELLCTNCRDWAHAEALAQHGPLRQSGKIQLAGDGRQEG